jgi:hypothetical protein
LRDYTSLVVYVREELGGGHEYDEYKPRLDRVRRIAELLPEARVKIVTASENSECRREVARLARILRHLAGWSTTIVEDDPGNRQRLAITEIPTFIIRSLETGREIGRIVRGPISGSLETDLLTIAEQNPSRVLA